MMANGYLVNGTVLQSLSCIIFYWYMVEFCTYTVYELELSTRYMSTYCTVSLGHTCISHSFRKQMQDNTALNISRSAEQAQYIFRQAESFVVNFQVMNWYCAEKFWVKVLTNVHNEFCNKLSKAWQWSAVPQENGFRGWLGKKLRVWNEHERGVSYRRRWWCRRQW